MKNDIQWIREKLHLYNLTAVAKRCKLSYSTVNNIASGKSLNPSFNTVKALLRFLTGDE